MCRSSRALAARFFIDSQCLITCFSLLQQITRAPSITTTSPAKTVELRPPVGPKRGGTAISVSVPPQATFPLVLATESSHLLNCTASAHGGKHDEAQCCCTPPAGGSSTTSLKLKPHAGWPAHTRFEHFGYYESPTLVSLKPTSGKVNGGASLTIAAKAWPPTVAPAPKESGGAASGGPKCRFGAGSNAPSVTATVLGADARSKTVARGRRPADETWIKCVAPPSTIAAEGSSEVAVFLAPNGVDFETAPALRFRYEGGGSGLVGIGATAAGGGSGIGWAGGAAITLVALTVVAILARLLYSLYRLRQSLDSSGWAEGTPEHWSAGRASREAGDDAIEDGDDVDVDDASRLVDGSSPRAAPATSERTPRRAVALSPAKIDITTADKELADDLKRLLVLAGEGEDDGPSTIDGEGEELIEAGRSHGR